MRGAAKVGLGTSWGFEPVLSPRGACWVVQGGLPRGVTAFRIVVRSDGAYDLDVRPSLGPWEDFAAGLTFPTPEAAAAYLVARVR